MPPASDNSPLNPEILKTLKTPKPSKGLLPDILQNLNRTPQTRNGPKPEQKGRSFASRGRDPAKAWGAGSPVRVPIRVPIRILERPLQGFYKDTIRAGRRIHHRERLGVLGPVGGVGSASSTDMPKPTPARLTSCRRNKKKPRTP